MALRAALPAEVTAFLDAHVDTVPQLEALLLLHERKDRCWLIGEIGSRLYLDRSHVVGLLRHLVHHRLATVEAGADEPLYSYDDRNDADGVVDALAATYRTQLITVTRFIHDKAPSSILDFARAFDFKGER